MKSLVVAIALFAGFLYNDAQAMGCAQTQREATANSTWGGPGLCNDSIQIEPYNSKKHDFQRWNADLSWAMNVASPARQQELERLRLQAHATWNREYNAVQAQMEKKARKVSAAGCSDAVQNMRAIVRWRDRLVDPQDIMHQFQKENLSEQQLLVVGRQIYWAYYLRHRSELNLVEGFRLTCDMMGSPLKAIDILLQHKDEG